MYVSYQLHPCVFIQFKDLIRGLWLAGEVLLMLWSDEESVCSALHAEGLCFTVALLLKGTRSDPWREPPTQLGYRVVAF